MITTEKCKALLDAVGGLEAAQELVKENPRKGYYNLEKKQYYSLNQKTGHLMRYVQEGCLPGNIQDVYYALASLDCGYVNLKELRIAICAAENRATKYDWENVPDNLQWIATDDNGDAYGFFDRPRLTIGGVWTESLDGCWKYSSYHIDWHKNTFHGDCEHSLEQRPQVQP